MVTSDEILHFFKDLSFESESHIYHVNGVPIECSVSNKIKKFYPEFDAKKKSMDVAIKRNSTHTEVLKEWNDISEIAKIKGTKAHLFGELYPFNRELRPQSNYDIAIMKFWKDLPPHIVPVLTEARMYHLKEMYAGTADLLLYNTMTGKYVIGDYKGLPLDTDILTNTGWKKMKDLSYQDKVFDREGKMCKITGISDIHNKPCLKIIFDNNEEIVCDEDHKWLVTFKNCKTYKEKVFTAKELKKHLDSSYRTYGNVTLIPSYLYPRIYNPKGINIEDVNLPIDPYVLGIWLGDGHKVDTKITQSNSKIWEEIEKRGYHLGNDVSKGGAGKAQTRTIFNILSKFRELDLLGNKHVPVEYLLSSRKQKIDLLRGLMDSDGYFNETRKRFVLATTKKEQVDFSVQILSSLGIKHTVIKCKKYCNGKTISGWDICFTTNDFNPFLCRNENIKINTNTEHKYRRIIAVESTEMVQTKCIEVDSPSHTYLATKSLIVTHNTNKDLYKNYMGEKMFSPFANMLNCPFNHYQLQLSYYQILLQQIEGIDVSYRKIIWLRPDGNYELYDTEDYTEILQYS